LDVSVDHTASLSYRLQLTTVLRPSCLYVINLSFYARTML